MASSTANLGLVLPFQSEAVSVTTQNDNLTKIDNAVNGLQDGMAILANGNTHAAIASGQYVYVRNHSSLAEGLYKATTAIATNGTLSTNNLTADSSGGFNDLKAQIDTLNGNCPKIKTFTIDETKTIPTGSSVLSLTPPAGVTADAVKMLVLGSAWDNIYYAWNPQPGERLMNTQNTWTFNVNNMRTTALTTNSFFAAVLY